MDVLMNLHLLQEHWEGVEDFVRTITGEKAWLSSWSSNTTLRKLSWCKMWVHAYNGDGVNSPWAPAWLVLYDLPHTYAEIGSMHDKGTHVDLKALWSYFKQRICPVCSCTAGMTAEWFTRWWPHAGGPVVVANGTAHASIYWELGRFYSQTLKMVLKKKYLIWVRALLILMKTDYNWPVSANQFLIDDVCGQISADDYLFLVGLGVVTSLMVKTLSSIISKVEIIWTTT